MCDASLRVCVVVVVCRYDLGRGINYLWVSDKDCEALGSAVVTERVPVPPAPAYAEDDDEEESADDEKVQFHNKIISIIGHEDGLGVESLMGAGKIAAETSIANRAIFTLSYSTARNIGIGSCVLRPPFTHSHAKSPACMLPICVCVT